MAPNTITHQDEKTGLEAVIRRLGPSMAKVVAETAGGFLAVEAMPVPSSTVIPRLPDFGVLRCSQNNLGEKRAMIFNLAVEKSEWKRLFTSGEDEDFRLDAFCEMANCICGSLTADPAFSGEFGYLLPNVPQAFLAKAPSEARSYHGAFRLGGVSVRFSISVHAIAGVLAPSAMMAA